MNKKKNQFQSTFLVLIIIMAVAGVFVLLVSYRLYSLSKGKINSDWNKQTESVANDINIYLSEPIEAVNLLADRLNTMQRGGATIEEVEEALVEETEVYSASIKGNSEGVYAFYKGTYIDGSGWVPPEDYVPTERDWYKAAYEGQGNTIIAAPYLDAMTGDIMLSVCQLLDDGESVVSMDIYLTSIQKYVEDSSDNPLILSAVLIDKDGIVVAHSNRQELGKDYSNKDSKGEFGYELFSNIKAGLDSPFDIVDSDDTYNVIIVESNMIGVTAPVSGGMHFCYILRKAGLYESLDYIYNVTALLLTSVLIAILSLFVYIDSKHRENAALYNDVQAIADIYVDMTRIDFKNDTMTYIKKSQLSSEYLEQPVEKFSTRVLEISSATCADQSRDMLSKFMDPTTIRKRLKDVNSLSCEFMNIEDKWVRVVFIVVDRDEDGLPTHAIMAFESVDEDKKQQEKLRKLSETDLMTGIRNRGSGESEIRRAMADGVPGMFCLLDADKFKSVNDNYGHSVGDKVIIALAESLSKTFRDSDVVFRLGGDEFAAFAKGVTTEEIGDRIMERLFNNIDSIDIPELKDRKISVSIGAAFYPANRNDSFEAMYDRADKGTYTSKKTDGNKVTYKFYEED